MSIKDITLQFIQLLSLTDWIQVGLCLLFAITCGRIIKALSRGPQDLLLQRLQIQIVRLVSLMYGLSIFYLSGFADLLEQSWIVRLVVVPGIVYLTHLVYALLSFFINRRFGRKKLVDGRSIYRETYSSRALTILTSIFCTVVGLTSVVQVLGFQSLLEAGSVIGFIGVLLALTQSSWAPDIISGLIILNSSFAEEDDVVQIKGSGINLVGVVFKTKMFHTELLDLANNHRVMIRNAKLRDLEIQSLSKFASAKGLREQLLFNIGYDVPTAQVHAFFKELEIQAIAQADILVEAQQPFECKVLDTGDNAVSWCFFYYTKDVKTLLRTRQNIRELALKLSQEMGVALATPALLDVTKRQEVSGVVDMGLAD